MTGVSVRPADEDVEAVRAALRALDREATSAHLLPVALIALSRLSARLSAAEQRADDALTALLSEHDGNCGCDQPGYFATCNLGATFVAVTGKPAQSGPGGIVGLSLADSSALAAARAGEATEEKETAT